MSAVHFENFATPSVMDPVSLSEFVCNHMASARGKEVPDLTDEERFALAFMSGCEIERGEYGLKIKNPIGIAKLDSGQFLVAEGRS